MRLRITTLTLVAAFCSFPLLAQTGELGLFVAASQVGDTRADESNVEFDNGLGFGISLNQYWGNLSGELAATALSQEGRVSVETLSDTELGDLDLIPITATLQFHFLRGSTFSPYIGGGAAYILADNLESENLDVIQVGPIEIQNEFTWALQGGVNIGLSRGLAIGLDAKYIAYSPEAAPERDPEDAIDLDLNPLIFSAGIKFRW